MLNIKLDLKRCYIVALSLLQYFSSTIKLSEFLYNISINNTFTD